MSKPTDEDRDKAEAIMSTEFFRVPTATANRLISRIARALADERAEALKSVKKQPEKAGRET